MQQGQETQLIAEALVDTPFQCKRLERLSGGYTNAIYRGELDDGTGSVVVKRTRGIVTPTWELGAGRSVRGTSFVFFWF